MAAVSTDKLTGLLLEKEFADRLSIEVQRALRYRRPLTLLLAEVAFEQFQPDRNLRWSMPYTIYKQLGPLINRQLRKVDMAGRIGGDMFAILLPETGLSGSFVAGDRIRKAVEIYEFLGDDTTSRVKVALNVGVATFPDHGLTGEELLSTAQRALLMVRRDGGNKAQVYPERIHDPVEVFRTLAPPYHGSDEQSPPQSAAPDEEKPPKPMSAAGQDSGAPE